MEIFDIVDQHDRVIGQASRAETHARGLKHRAVHILLFNAAGDLFIQQRAASKDTFPGRYDSSASGHLDSGENYDAAAVRELHEELGVAVPLGTLRRQFSLPATLETGQEFVWVYTLRGDYRPAINPVELAGGEFWSVAKIRQAIQSQADQFAPAFILVFRTAFPRKDELSPPC
jgi:isopentenyl-diphosphate delta-isomerase type 1